MADPLASLRRLIKAPSDAVRWACLLEVMSPKAGNVYPGRSFGDLTFGDFVSAAEISARRFGSVDEPIAKRMYDAVAETFSVTNTNVNLGIVLLLGPLVAADERMSTEGVEERTARAWVDAIDGVLSNFDGSDGRHIIRAIQLSHPGGMGRVQSMDVASLDGDVDILGAMKLAADRDRIARQYATGFADLIDVIVPVVWDSIATTGDLLDGIGRSQIQLLRMEPDSLIARKNGKEVAASVQRRAEKVDLDNPLSVQKFDDSLRSSSHKFNPGTTADLIAAALYLLLRTPLL